MIVHTHVERHATAAAAARHERHPARDRRRQRFPIARGGFRSRRDGRLVWIGLGRRRLERGPLGRRDLRRGQRQGRHCRMLDRGPRDTHSLERQRPGTASRERHHEPLRPVAGDSPEARGIDRVCAGRCAFGPMSRAGDGDERGQGPRGGSRGARDRDPTPGWRAAACAGRGVARPGPRSHPARIPSGRGAPHQLWRGPHRSSLGA